MNPTSGQTRDEWFAPPALEARELARLATTHFGIDGDLTALRGEREQNALISSPHGSFVLKVAGASEDLLTLDFQCRALEHVALHDPSLPVPRVVPSEGGEAIVVADVGSEQLAVRVLTYLPGRTFDDLAVISAAGLRGVGAFQGRLASVLATFEHPGAETFMPWALDSGMLDNSDVWAHLGPDAARLVEPCRERVTAAVGAMASLRRHVIHNDAHRGNQLRAEAADESPEAVTGIIDFGDLVTSAAAADLGVSGASFVGQQPDPAGAFVEMVRGYHRSRPLDVDELTLLPELVLCRLVLSSLMTDYQIHHSAHIAGLVAAERAGVLGSLRRWAALDPGELTDRLQALLDEPR
jgi:hydroxylysine kinase